MKDVSAGGELRLRRIMNGLILQMARGSSQLTQEQCAAWLGVDVADFATWEAGEQDIPASYFHALAQRLAVTIDQFADEPTAPRDIGPAEHVAQNLRAARTAAAITVDEVAVAAGLSPQEWEAVEAGIQPIGIAALATVARRLGRPLGDFFALDHGRASSAPLAHLSPELADWVADPANAAALAAARQLASLPPDDLLTLSQLLGDMARQERPE
ncbi:MAG: helix-turn-helix domain-containing protein [Ardenticatenaceae bacterium]|nr:helix-turn-helix domain-containing protein [Ardenticatenaceae bacterium]